MGYARLWLDDDRSLMCCSTAKSLGFGLRVWILKGLLKDCCGNSASRSLQSIAAATFVWLLDCKVFWIFAWYGYVLVMDFDDRLLKSPSRFGNGFRCSTAKVAGRWFRCSTGQSLVVGIVGRLNRPSLAMWCGRRGVWLGDVEEAPPSS